jgi:hypothetical protein
MAAMMPMRLEGCVMAPSSRSLWRAYEKATREGWLWNAGRPQAGAVLDGWPVWHRITAPV